MKKSITAIIQSHIKKIKFIMEYSNYREINSKADEISF